MASKTPLEQTYADQPFELIPRWLWSMGVGLILILGGIWLIWTRTALGSSWDANKSGTTSVESAPSAGQADPDFELKNRAGETIRLAGPIPQFGLPFTSETTLVEVILVMTLVPRLRALDARVMSTASSSMCQTDSRSKV